MASEDRNRAFNVGCEARLAGKSIMSNPYDSGGTEYLYWAMGWRDVHHHWGQWNKNAPKLPKVERALAC